MRGLAVVLLFAALTAPAAADTVYLVNGNKFEEVVAERAGAEVRILLPHGEIVLPVGVIARVERSPSVWREFDRRRTTLLDSSAAARAWLELARWADAAGYERGMRDAALRAAEIDAGLAGLAPLMARIGWIRDRQSGRWLAEEIYMYRRGYRLWGDRWLPAEEHEARLRAQREAEKMRREDARQERITRAIEALVVAQLSRAAEPPPPPASRGGSVVGVYTGGYFLSGPPAPVRPPPPVAPRQATLDDLTGRQPGSLFPIEPRRRLTSAE